MTTPAAASTLPPPIDYDRPPETRAFWAGRLPHWDVLGRVVAYIRNNPVWAGLVKNSDLWPYGSWKM